MVDQLLLTPVSELTHSIRENSEQLAQKIRSVSLLLHLFFHQILKLFGFCFRILFQNKTEIWDEIEAKLNSDTAAPLLQTNSKVRPGFGGTSTGFNWI